MAGGRVTSADASIPIQAPEAAPLEQWDMGIPERRVNIDDPQWTLHGLLAGLPARGEIGTDARGPRRG